MPRIPGDAKSGFWLVLGGIAALALAAYIMRKVPL